MQTYGNVGGFADLKCIVWVGNAMTPVKTGQVEAYQIEPSMSYQTFHISQRPV